MLAMGSAPRRKVPRNSGSPAEHRPLRRSEAKDAKTAMEHVMQKLPTKWFRSRALFLAALCLSLAPFPARAQDDDPPVRVARISYVSGDVSFQPGGEDDWGWAAINRPMTTGDALWVERGSRAELAIGANAMRLGEETDFS